MVNVSQQVYRGVLSWVLLLVLDNMKLETLFKSGIRHISSLNMGLDILFCDRNEPFERSSIYCKSEEDCSMRKISSLVPYTRITSIKINYSLKVPEKYEKCLRVSSSVKEKPFPKPPSWREWATSQTDNVGGDRMSRGMGSPSTKCQRPSLKRMSGQQRSGKHLVLRIGNYP